MDGGVRTPLATPIVVRITEARKATFQGISLPAGACRGGAGEWIEI
jgi:hypothetical protein